MDYETFLTEWIPEHNPLSPKKDLYGIGLYLNEEGKVRNMLWIDNPINGKYFRHLFHDKERTPLPDVKPSEIDEFQYEGWKRPLRILLFKPEMK